MRLGLIGAGGIAQDHINAAKICGFNNISICGKNNSQKAINLAKKNSKVKSVSSIGELLDESLDALAVAVPAESTIEILNQCKDLDLPILIEKPGAVNSSDFDEIEKMNIEKLIFGYNRRHYSSVSKLKKELESKNEVMVQVNIPEISWDTNPTYDLRRKMLFENAVHVFDLLNFIFGDIEINFKSTLMVRERPSFQINTFRVGKNIIGVITFSFGSPGNISISCSSRGELLELAPLEIFHLYNGMDFIPSSPNKPFKEYFKKKDAAWQIDRNDLIAKPGFIGQYNDLKSLIGDSSNPLKSANIKDARRAFELAKTFNELLLEKR